MQNVHTEHKSWALTFQSNAKQREHKVEKYKDELLDLSMYSFNKDFK